MRILVVEGGQKIADLLKDGLSAPKGGIRYDNIELFYRPFRACTSASVMPSRCTGCLDTSPFQGSVNSLFVISWKNPGVSKTHSSIYTIVKPGFATAV